MKTKISALVLALIRAAGGRLGLEIPSLGYWRIGGGGSFAVLGGESLDGEMSP